MYKHVVLALIAIVIFQTKTHAQHRGFNADSKDYENMMNQLKVEERFMENCTSFQNKLYTNDQGSKIYLSLNCQEKTLIVQVNNQSIQLSKQCEDHRFKSYIQYSPLSGRRHDGISVLSYTLTLSFEVDQEDEISSDYKSMSLLDFKYNLTDKNFILSGDLEKPFDLDSHDKTTCRCRTSDNSFYSDGFLINQSSCCHSPGGSRSRVRCNYTVVFNEQQ
ncbi:hypothetical protein MRY82_09950 [bacterium]|nr:hypothetical protein [bacterium]